MKHIIVSDTSDIKILGSIPAEFMDARQYLEPSQLAGERGVRIYNMCKSYRYQSSGYYVSLLAEARGHRAIPDATTIQDLKTPTVVRVLTEELEEIIDKTLGGLKSERFDLSIYFGQSMARKHERIARELFAIFQAPLLQAKFIKEKKWLLYSLQAISLKDVPANHRDALEGMARPFFERKRHVSRKTQKTGFDLAILVNAEEKHPPSNAKALANFMEAFEDAGFLPEQITKEDAGEIGEYDALFIRETTSVNHHTYRLSRRAKAEGLVVIDDPDSILRCANKIYLSESLSKAKVATPQTVIVHKKNLVEAAKVAGMPCVLKLPDSSFSVGVIMVESVEEFKMEALKLLETSDLILAQSFLSSEFDWRIGVLDKRPIYACKYYMAKDHWQIYNWSADGFEDQNGNTETLPIRLAPDFIVRAALKASNLIGDGLYGVDIKEVDGAAYVIEVNDNPNIDAGIEDEVLKGDLYRLIAQSFSNRVLAKRGLIG